MLLSLLIVNYHTDDHINALLQDLSRQSFELFEVIVVNNALHCQIDIERPFAVHLVQSPYNQGFGRAMNLAASHAKGKHLLVVNPDLLIKDECFLSKIYDAIFDKDYGIATCRLLNKKQEDKSEFFGFEFDAALLKQGQVAWLSGAFLVIAKSNYERLGGFDPDFFMYCEDEDLCLRATQNGMSFLKLNHLSVGHIGAVSEPIKGYDFFYRWFRSQFLFIHKHLDSKDFEKILIDINHKSNKKHQTYRALRFLKIPRYLTKLNEWSAMKDVTDKILIQGTDWLYFKANDNEGNNGQ